MKIRKITVCSLLLIVAILLGTGLFACKHTNGAFTVYGHENKFEYLEKNLNTPEDVKNLVTDDDKLVINYYDAYTWVVFFGDSGNIEHMIYIYEFDSDKKAISIVDERVKELQRNSTMKILSSKVIGSYVAVDLIDSSFTNITRSMLEHNFSLLVVK